MPTPRRAKTVIFVTALWLTLAVALAAGWRYGLAPLLGGG